MLIVGEVVAFDEHLGLGTVGNGTDSWSFHCTALADGSRRVDVGQKVAFVVRPGAPGRWEAFEVTSV